MNGWIQASYEADLAYQLFARTKDCPDPQSASTLFNDAKVRLQRSAHILPEGRKIVELCPPTIPSDTVYQLLSKVGLGAELTEMTKLVNQVNTLESQLREAKAENEALKGKLRESHLSENVIRCI
jgi:hypothetical protein